MRRFCLTQSIAAAQLCLAGRHDLRMAYVVAIPDGQSLRSAHAIQTTRGVGRLGEIRGYMGPWFAEWYYLRDDKVLERALQLRERAVRSSDAASRPTIPIHKHLVILQAESLDFNMLGFKVDGVEVTPFLNRLRDNRCSTAFRAIHFNGSSDADFAALNARGRLAARKPLYHSRLSLREHDAPVSGPMRLLHLQFSRQRRASFTAAAGPSSKWDLPESIFARSWNQRWLQARRLGRPRSDVLQLSAQKLAQCQEPTCHFVITLTTTRPYTLLDDHEKEIFPHPAHHRAELHQQHALPR